MHIATDRLEKYANGSLDAETRREVARHLSTCRACLLRATDEVARASVATTTLFGGHLDAAAVEALALREAGATDSEAEGHIAVCAACRTEVEDLARFAHTVEESAPVVAPSSRIPDLVRLPEEERRKAAASTTWSLAELQEMNAVSIASEKAGPAGDYADAELLLLMCDHAEAGIPPVILGALKVVTSYRIAFAGVGCGSGSRSEAVLKGAEELARELPNADYYAVCLDLARVCLQDDFGARDVSPAGSAEILDHAVEIALSFGDRRLYFLVEQYRGLHHTANGRFALAAEAYVTATRTSIPWHRQAALVGASFCFSRLGDVDRAEECLRRAEEERIDPPNQAAVRRFPLERGLIAMGRGQYAEACRLIREAIAALDVIAPHDAIFLYIDLAEAHVLGREYPEAIEAARHAISYFAKLPPSFALSQAMSVLKEAFDSREVASIRASLEEARILIRTGQTSPMIS